MRCEGTWVRLYTKPPFFKLYIIKKILTFLLQFTIPFIMKKQLCLFVIFSLFTFALAGQKNVPATITMKDGSSVEVYHFGRLICESNRYAETYTTLRGKYNYSPTEIKDYTSNHSIISWHSQCYHLFDDFL